MGIRAHLYASVAVSIAAVSPANASDWNAPVSFAIAPQPLDSALLAYSQQSGIPVMSASQAVSNKRTPGFRGVTKPLGALSALLKGTDLTFTRSGSDAISIVPVARPRVVPVVARRVAANVAPATVPDPAPPQETGGLEEIIVTAQRRGENLQDVPISVNALTAKELKAMGGTSSEDLTLIPNVVYNPGVGGGQVTIRGIGGLNSGGEEPANAIYIDGVYQFAPTANLFQFNSVERIEVLKGPQGTLFGRNTAGGVIQVVTRDPSQEAAGEAEIGYANYQTVNGSLYLNAPLTDNLAANLSAYGSDQGKGWGRNVFTGRDVHKGYSWGVRGKLKWDAPSGNTDLILSAMYTKDEPVASGAGTIVRGTLDVLGSPSVGLFNTHSELDERRVFEQYQVAGTIHQDLGFARLTSITAYSDVKFRFLADGDLTPAPIVIVDISGNYRSFSQELQLQSKEGSPLQWIAGLFYLDGPTAFHFNLSGLAFGGHTIAFPTAVKTRSYAGFGQASYALTDSTKLTAGLRYTADKRRLTAPGVTSVASDRKPTWRLAIDHKISEDVLAYASYSRGFKSGVYNAGSPDKPAADATSLDAYEVGLKTQTSDRRFRANLAAFYYDYKDVQIQLIEITRYFVNGGDARSYGVDLDLAAEPVRNLTLTGGVSILNTKFTKYDMSKPLPPCYFVPPAPTGGLVVDSCSPVGNQLPFAPKFTGSAAFNYKHETDLGDFVVTGAYSYNSGYYTEASNFELGRTKSFEMVNASLTWVSSNENFHVGVWGKNLLNELRTGSADVSNIGALVYPLAPRTYGVTLGAKF